MQRLGMAYKGETDRYYDTLLVLYSLNRQDFAPGGETYVLHGAAGVSKPSSEC